MHWRDYPSQDSRIELVQCSALRCWSASLLLSEPDRLGPTTGHPVLPLVPCCRLNECNRDISPALNWRFENTSMPGRSRCDECHGTGKCEECSSSGVNVRLNQEAPTCREPSLNL